MNTHVCILHAVGFWLSTFLLGLSKYLRTPISKTKLLHSESMHYISAHCKDEIVNVSSFLFLYRRDVMYFVQCCQLQTQSYAIVFCLIPQTLGNTYF